MKFKDFKAIFTPFTQKIYFSTVFDQYIWKRHIIITFIESFTVMFIKDRILLLLLDENIQCFTIFCTK